MIRATRRTSRRTRRCERCYSQILPGDEYLESIASPHHDDLGNQHWWRMAECKPCATSCRRWPSPVPTLERQPDLPVPEEETQ